MGGLPLLVGLSGSTNRNSVASFMEASASRRRLFDANVVHQLLKRTVVVLYY